jgi:hypothetical protein
MAGSLGHESDQMAHYPADPALPAAFEPAFGQRLPFLPKLQQLHDWCH